MAQNERDTQRMIELLDQGRHWAALWVAVRPSRIEICITVASVIGVVALIREMAG